jgi:hypothetical protein
MRRTLVLGTILVGVWAATASADGVGPAPGESWGWDGVIGPKGDVRYVTVPARNGTVVESIRVHGGRVLRTRHLAGAFGVPVVAWDGSAGGLSRDGRKLVLVSHQSANATRFVVLNPWTFRVRARLRLPGYWAFDAISPGGSLMYLTQYIGGLDPSGQQPYAVRVLNLNTHRLYAGALVDKREPDEKMTGRAMTRTESHDGGWAYTLYSRQTDRPFVHALDTLHRRAFCVDLPWRSSATWIGNVRMRVRGNELLLFRGGKAIARVDRTTFAVRR